MRTCILDIIYISLHCIGSWWRRYTKESFPFMEFCKVEKVKIRGNKKGGEVSQPSFINFVRACHVTWGQALSWRKRTPFLSANTIYFYLIFTFTLSNYLQFQSSISNCEEKACNKELSSNHTKFILYIQLMLSFNAFLGILLFKLSVKGPIFIPVTILFKNG